MTGNFKGPVALLKILQFVVVMATKVSSQCTICIPKTKNQGPFSVSLIKASCSFLSLNWLVKLLKLPPGAYFPCSVKPLLHFGPIPLNSDEDSKLSIQRDYRHVVLCT